MEYTKTIKLKDGRECVLRNGTRGDAEQELELFRQTHGQTDFLTSYPDEISYTVSQQAEYIEKKRNSPDEIELLAQVGDRIVGLGGLDRIGWAEKTRHRGEFGVCIDRDFWGLGIGRALTLAVIECARLAGYSQLELEAVADNGAALALYESTGFTEYGRNPRGFRSRLSGWQELVLMRIELD